MQETQVRSLVWEDLLEKGMAMNCSILAWRILWTEEPGRLQSMVSQRVRHNWVIRAHVRAHTYTHTHTYVKPSLQARYRQLPWTSSYSLWPFGNDPFFYTWPWANYWRQLLMWFVSLEYTLHFLEFYLNRIIPYKHFWIWLFWLSVRILRAFLIAQLVKNPPAMQESWVWSLGWEDPLEKGMASFRKGRGTRDQIANICWIIGKAREFQKNIYFCSLTTLKHLIV